MTRSSITSASSCLSRRPPLPQVIVPAPCPPRSGLAGLLLVNRSAQVDDVDLPTESIVKIAEEAKAR
jgi:hypothetical protein